MGNALFNNNRKDKSTAKSSIRRRADTLLDGLNRKGLIAAAKGIHEAKEPPE